LRASVQHASRSQHDAPVQMLAMPPRSDRALIQTDSRLRVSRQPNHRDNHVSKSWVDQGLGSTSMPEDDAHSSPVLEYTAGHTSSGGQHIGDLEHTRRRHIEDLKSREGTIPGASYALRRCS